MSHQNAKNQLKELLESRGTTLEQGAVFRDQQRPDGTWESTVTVTAPGLPSVTGHGTAPRLRQAQVEAARVALDALGASVPEWSRVLRDAQAGDALIKLSAYLAEDLDSPESVSLWLQANENDAELARRFDEWKAAGLDDVVAYGTGLGTKYKASVVEAVLWRRFGARVFGTEAASALTDLRAMLQR